jgi:hypothetical protein
VNPLRPDRGNLRSRLRVSLRRAPRASSEAAGRALLAVVGAVALTAAVVFLMRQSGVGIPYPLALTVVLVLLALRWIVHRVAPAPPEVDAAAGPAPAADTGGYDWSGVELIGSPMTRWESRLDWVGGEPERFAAGVRPALAAVVDERLRLRHGITRTGDPRQARVLLGEPLWRLLAEEPVQRIPTPAELSVLIAAAERL